MSATQLKGYTQRMLAVAGGKQRNLLASATDKGQIVAKLSRAATFVSYVVDSEALHADNSLVDQWRWCAER